MNKAEKRRIAARDIAAAIFFFSLSGIVFLVSVSYPSKGLMYGGGPGIYPLILSVFLGMLTCLLVVQMFSQKRKEGAQKHPSKVTEKKYLLLVLVTVLLIAYWLVLPFLHYPIATFLFMWVCIWTLSDEKSGWSRIIHGLLYAAGLTGFVYLIFQKGLTIPLP